MTAKTESQQRAAGPFGWRTVTPLVMGSALNPVNSSLIATALVPIAAALHIPVGRTAILVSSLYLACAIAQPTAGKLAEEFGPRRIFLAGIVLVLLGGVVGGLGHNLTVLVVARVLIGAGTSGGYPSAMVIIRRRSHQAGLGEPPGSVLGSLAIAGSATVAIGPPIGGLLVGGLGWRSAFLLNVPLTAVALAMALAWIPRDEQPAAGRKIAEVATRIDLGGIALFGGMLAALLVFLMSLPRPGWVALAISAVLAALLVAWELRAARPFIDLRLLASARALTRTYLRLGLTLLGVYVVLYGITQWMEAARGLSPEQAGLVLLPMGAVAAFVSHPVSRRNLVRGPLIACAFFMLLASVAALFITGHSPVIALVGVMVLFGVVVGTTSVGNQTALYLQSPPENVGTASGLSRTFGYIGSIASATITSIVFHARVSDAGLHDMALILVGVAAVVLLMTLLDRQLSRGSKALSSATPSSPGPKGDVAQASGRGERAVRTAVATTSAGTRPDPPVRWRKADPGGTRD
jgi:MFS family permease